MSAKIKSMELVHADILYPDQLMPNDIIKVENDLLTIVSVEDTETGYKIKTLNEFGEEDFIETDNETRFNLFVFVGNDWGSTPEPSTTYPQALRTTHYPPLLDPVSLIWYIYSMFNYFQKPKEQIRRIQELRRSGASTPMPNKKKYSRKNKHKGKENE